MLFFVSKYLTILTITRQFTNFRPKPLLQIDYYYLLCTYIQNVSQLSDWMTIFILQINFIWITCLITLENFFSLLRKLESIPRKNLLTANSLKNRQRKTCACVCFCEDSLDYNQRPKRPSWLERPRKKWVMSFSQKRVADQTQRRTVIKGQKESERQTKNERHTFLRGSVFFCLEITRINFLRNIFDLQFQELFFSLIQHKQKNQSIFNEAKKILFRNISFCSGKVIS